METGVLQRAGVAVGTRFGCRKVGAASRTRARVAGTWVAVVAVHRLALAATRRAGLILGARVVVVTVFVVSLGPTGGVFRRFADKARESFGAGVGRHTDAVDLANRGFGDRLAVAALASVNGARVIVCKTRAGGRRVQAAKAGGAAVGSARVAVVAV